MKDRLTRPGGRVLLVLLIGSLLTAFAGAGLVMAQDANPVRALPAQVTPGQQFDVTVTFTSPADDFNAIGLSDVAPAGWTVAVNTAWTAPTAMTSHTPTADEAVYIWSGPHAAGVTFTATYKVQVPAGAAPGTYTFPGGELEFYIADQPANEQGYINPITGPNQVEVVQEHEVTFMVTDDAEPPVPIQGALVTVNGLEGLTDADGRVTFPLPGGTYSYTVTKAGYTTVTGTVVVPAQAITVPVRLSLVPPVGGTADRVSRLPILALWIAIGAAIIAGAGLFVRHRRATR